MKYLDHNDFNKISTHIVEITDQNYDIISAYLSTSLQLTKTDIISIITDNNTNEVLGKKITNLLSLQYRINPINFIGKISSSNKEVEIIRNSLEDSKLVLAIGSGTINDLAKYCSYEKQIPYIIIPTAPSMNGYLSSNASLRIGKYHSSEKAHLPNAMFVDFSIIKEAPIRLICAGISDSLCRSTVIMDWLLASLIHEEFYQKSSFTPYHAIYFKQLEQLEKQLISNIDLILQKDEHIIALLFKSLLLQGVLMHNLGNSMPASQGEHMITHFINMLFDNSQTYLHGEQIAMSTLLIKKEQDEILSTDNLSFFPISFQTNHDFLSEHSYLSSSERRVLIEQFKKNHKTKHASLDINRLSILLQKNRSFLQKHQEEHCLSRRSLQNIHNDLGIKTLPEDLGYSNDIIHFSLYNSYKSRDRFTFLDIITMLKEG